MYQNKPCLKHCFMVELVKVNRGPPPLKKNYPLSKSLGNPPDVHVMPPISGGLNAFLFGAPNCWSSAQRKFTSLSCRISFSETSGKWAGLEEFGAYPITHQKKTERNWTEQHLTGPFFAETLALFRTWIWPKQSSKQSCNIQSDTGLARRSAIFVKSLAKEELKFADPKKCDLLTSDILLMLVFGVVSTTQKLDLVLDAAAICHQGCPAGWNGSLKGLGVHQIQQLIWSTSPCLFCQISLPDWENVLQPSKWVWVVRMESFCLPGKWWCLARNKTLFDWVFGPRFFVQKATFPNAGLNLYDRTHPSDKWWFVVKGVLFPKIFLLKYSMKNDN